MKYKNIYVGWNNDSVSTTRVCSKCEHEVRDDDLYCSHCGRKFKQLANFLSKAQILEIINGEQMKPVKKNPADCSIPTINSDDISIVQTCIGGRVNIEGCPYLSADGYCMRSVLTSMPPQYEKCQFCHLGGPQYKPCKDVELPVSRTKTAANNAGKTDIDKKSIDDFCDDWS